MYKVALINMPFADANRPSVSLTQLAYLLNQKDGIEAKVHYFNQDAYLYFGADLIHAINAQYTSGLGDWVFRLIAFPQLRDNFQTYFTRHFPQKSPQVRNLIRELLRKRQGLTGFLDQLIDEHRLDEVDMAGFTSMFSQNVASFAMAKRLKNRRHDMVTVMGGANCETPMGQALVRHVPQIDFVFSGPALISLPKAVDALHRGDPDTVQHIKGVFSKDNVDRLCRKDVVGEELPLDVPIPLDYRGFIDRFDTMLGDSGMRKTLIFETSRGCWWGERSHCTFCGLNGASMGYRSMKPELAIDQFNFLFDNYADDCDRFSCVDNILPKNYVAEVFPYIDPPENTEIFYEVKADLKASEMEVLSAKRVKVVQPGIEALSTATLKLMKKGTTAAGNIAFLKNCMLYDIQPAWNLLVGFPGEQIEVFEKYLADLPLLTHLHPPGGCFPVRFDRYSPYFMKAEAYQLDLKPYEFYGEVYPFDEATRRDMAYYFQDRNYEAAYIRNMAHYIDRVRKVVAHWQQRFATLDGKAIPELYFSQDNPHEVVDTRQGEVTVHRVGEIGRQVLKVLDKASALPTVAAAMRDIPDFQPEPEIDRLRAMKLIFQEGSRYLSLVLPHRAANPERYVKTQAALVDVG